uniref:Uncharacterized protein n=1 Tax=Anguilla anguilla TaxID=7936 RepID=A0A0E9SH74_ANGAN
MLITIFFDCSFIPLVGVLITNI